MKPLLLTLACTLALAACSKAKQPDPPPPPAPAPAGKTVFDPQLKALQKAKDVQKTVDDQNKQQQKQLEDSGG
jgi:hypothetical protein